MELIQIFDSLITIISEFNTGRKVLRHIRMSAQQAAKIFRLIWSFQQN